MAGVGAAIQVLLNMDSRVDDAEEKQIEHKAVREWLQQLQDDVFYAEDLMDEICTDALRHRLDAERQTKKSPVVESKGLRLW
ncbi:putative disease resistance rpp13-like protein 1 [Quercus suber]|uniref:Disease resistance rpp13-like protein 1 n=1 Tax=Quercus suber TaxID=58331 RepID=A0AAW0J7K6_QUESU